MTDKDTHRIRTTYTEKMEKEDEIINFSAVVLEAGVPTRNGNIFNARVIREVAAKMPEFGVLYANFDEDESFVVQIAFRREEVSVSEDGMKVTLGCVTMPTPHGKILRELLKNTPENYSIAVSGEVNPYISSDLSRPRAIEGLRPTRVSVIPYRMKGDRPKDGGEEG